MFVFLFYDIVFTVQDDKTDCGWPGMDQDICGRRGCNWDNSKFPGCTYP